MILINQLQDFRAALLQRPAADDTYELWMAVESKLSLSHQSQLLLAWNKYLVRRHSGDEVREVFTRIIWECRQPTVG